MLITFYHVVNLIQLSSFVIQQTKHMKSQSFSYISPVQYSNQLMQADSDYKLPTKFICYKRSFDAIMATRELFQTLLIDCQLCVRCIFRLYNFEHPRLYSDSGFITQVLPVLLDYNQEHLARYKPHHLCVSQVCWLCQGIFQAGFLRTVTDQIREQIQRRSFGEYPQFKLNIRIPNIHTLRNVLLLRYLHHHTVQKRPDATNLLYHTLISTFQTNKAVEFKTVLKWLLADTVREATGMGSTAQDHPDNLVIAIDLDNSDLKREKDLMALFVGKIGLTQKKEKVKKGRKVIVDLGLDKGQVKCNSYNIGKICALKQQDYSSIFQNIKGTQDFINLLCGEELVRVSSITHSVSLLTKHIYLCGRYIKFSRYLSQTPWIIDGKKLTEGSLQEQIQDPLIPLFFPGKPREQVETAFHAGGREDIDVRMLQGGRPFVLQLKSPITSLKSLKIQDVLAQGQESKRAELKEQWENWIANQMPKDAQNPDSLTITKLLELVVNSQTPLVQVLGLQETTEAFIRVDLKKAQMEKVKHYLCFIHSLQPLTQEDATKLNSLHDVILEQLTPLRVLHRRTLMTRQKVIHRMKMHLVSSHSGVLEVWASAGTYIKEFVHGDLGRTLPNVGSLLGKQVDILQLDVGSLKEGEWRAGDEQKMQIDRFPWLEAQ